MQLIPEPSATKEIVKTLTEFKEQFGGTQHLFQQVSKSVIFCQNKQQTELALQQTELALQWETKLGQSAAKQQFLHIDSSTIPRTKAQANSISLLDHSELSN